MDDDGIIIIIIIYLFLFFIYLFIFLRVFFPPALADGFLQEFEWQQVSRTLLIILNNAVVWMVSTHPLISKSSSPCTNPLVTVPIALITTGIIATFMFHSFFNSRARSRYLSLFSHSFNFPLWSVGTEKSTILQVLFFLFCCLLKDLVVRPRFGDLFVSQNPRGVCASLLLLLLLLLLLSKFDKIGTL